MMGRTGTWLLVAGLAAGCSLFRANPLEQGRGAVVLVFDTRTAGDMKSLRKTLSEQDACATFFAAGQISRGQAGLLFDLRSDGHEIGLSGLEGLNPRLYCSMYGLQKYFQDEIVTQVLDAKRQGLNPRFYLLPTLDRARGDVLKLPSFLVSKGFARVVHRMPNAMRPQARPAAELVGAPLVHAYAMTTNVLDRAQISALAKRNEILVVVPNRQVLPMLLETVRAQGVPFATLSDLR